jgi:SAM-dependent methyltransferase
MQTPTSRPDPGSFRDPLSRVYVDDAGVWRGLSKEALADYEALAASAFFTAALDRGDVIGTELVDDTAAHAAVPDDWAAVLRHERIDVISYPYEWPFEMLRDAARLQLSLARGALAEKLITKDATPYNVQFAGTKPVFIDVGSFERLRPSEPWPGYRQFCELFLNPLLIQAVRDVPFQPLLRGSIHGISPATAADLLRGSGGLQKGVFTHVKLHARAERRYADADRERDVKAELKQAGFGPGLIDAQLRNLEKAVEALRWRQQASTWSDYGDRAHYSPEDLRAKEAFVTAAIDPDSPPPRVLDLGANDGRFSRLAVAAGAQSVIAVDSDDVVVDRLYRDLRAEGERRILPLVLDLSDPSPGLGWRGRERPPFVERVRPDLVLCLAVVHHLALTNTVPLDEIVGFLADFGSPLVVEFPHRDDVMAARLLARKRPGVFDAYDVTTWEQALARHFSVRTRETLPSGTRTLYLCYPA